MKKILQIASAFIGIIIGAGFASGQEILQYFTSFGHLGTAAAAVSTVFFAYMGMTLTKLGSRMKAKSHRDVIYKISGRFLGRIIDYILILCLLGFGVVMIAGGGSTLNQQFGLPHYMGSLLITLLVIITIMGNVNRVVQVIGSITPFLIVSVIAFSIYSLLTMESSFAVLEPIAKEQTSAMGNWVFSVINYVSFNVALGASMAIVMGGDEKNERMAAMGGLVGGTGIGLLIIVSHLTLFAKIDIVAGYDMPMLKIADSISPILGIFYSLVLFGMVFNTAVSMFYSFGARFIETETKKFKIFTAAVIFIAFGLSFIGFTDLVSILYPLFGYMGLVLVAVLVIASITMARGKGKEETKASEEVA